MHVSAGNAFRRWPIESFAAVASRLVGIEPRRRVVVTSGPSERQAAEQVIAEARALLPEGDRLRVLQCGEFSLLELRALVDSASLFIGGDSGPLHLAATSHVPIVGLYGPTLPARSAPWRAPLWLSESVETMGLPCRPCEQRVCEPGDFRCLRWIRPEQVVEAAERLLARAGAKM
jgi:ADP-heptose:LPS heptosyltransferase